MLDAPPTPNTSTGPRGDRPGTRYETGGFAREEIKKLEAEGPSMAVEGGSTCSSTQRTTRDGPGRLRQGCMPTCSARETASAGPMEVCDNCGGFDVHRKICGEKDEPARALSRAPTSSRARSSSKAT